MHPTIEKMVYYAGASADESYAEILSEQVEFRPPTYYKTWVGREPVAAVLGHVKHVFSDFSYRRIMGAGKDWALEFQCKVGELDAIGVDLITLDENGFIAQFEVVMRPYKTVGALREAMNARVMTDARFLKFQTALR